MSIKQLLILTLLLGVTLPGTVQATTYMVTKTADTNDGTCGADCSLREAVVAANASSGSDTISLPGGTYTFTLSGSGEDAAATGDLDITDTSGTLTITGAGSSSTTISAGALTDRVFEVRSSASVSMSALTITGGTISGMSGLGAGIRMDGTALTLSSVIISSNTFTNTDSFGFSQGGGVYCSTGTLTVTNSTISSNGAASGEIDGAGAFVGNSCAASFDTVTLSSNLGIQRGGGLYIGVDTAVTKTFTNLTVSGNAANVGGGIFALGSSSSDLPVTITNSTVTSNTATQAGAGVAFAGKVQATNLTITSNSSRGDAGGVYVYNDTYVDAVLAFSTVVNNTANSDSSGGGNGGGIYVEGSSADFTLQTSLVAGNLANSASGPNCYATAGFTAATYTFFENTTDCTITTSSNNVTNSSVSSIVSLSLASNGGSVQTLATTGSNVTDQVPSAACLSATGASLTVDARGMTRPQSTMCDRGAYEKDQTSPTVTITSGTDTVQCATGSWTNAGATATDNFSTGLTASTSNTVNVNTLGAQTITYTSTADVDGNTGTNTRTVTVVDTTVPTITLTGSATVTQTVGTTYTDAGATASDTCDSSVAVTTAGSVDTNTAGSYTLTYSAQDDTGNAAVQVTRTVTITEASTEDTDEEETPEETTENASKDIVTVTQAGTDLVIVYSDDTTDTVEPFTDSSNYHYAVSSDAKRLVVTNGKLVKVYVAGSKVAQKKIAKKKLSKAFYKLAVKSFYDGYDSIVVVRSVTSSQASIIVARLTAADRITKLKTKKTALVERKPIRLRFKLNKHKFTTRLGSGKQQRSQVWKLKSSGALVKL
ncbi:MAG: DUF5011 domain-containing protein [Candidatus Kerfeldbacteria bacterium]|nr:DUF5011 domain-containing protein [Candidatus Kerfeldbacteria bacterium]